MRKSISHDGERGFLSWLLPQLQKKSHSFFKVPPGDDGAVLTRPKGLVLSIDGLAENTHFRLSWAAQVKKNLNVGLGRALGWKLVGSSLSDLAAMGDVRDRWILIYAGLPRSIDNSFLRDFYLGVRESTSRYHCALVGGDTVQSSQVALVAAVGGNCEAVHSYDHRRESGIIYVSRVPLGMRRRDFSSSKEKIRSHTRPPGFL